MKRILILLFVLAELASYGQAKIGMSPIITFTPASATSPTSSVTYSSSVIFKAWVKNYGNAPFTSSVTVMTKRDTTFGSIVDSVTIGLTLNPNDSIAVSSSFVPSPGLYAFKSGGNGNTIVVWPYIFLGGGIQGDSVRSIIWVSGFNGISELETNSFKLYPNPVIHDLTIKAQSNSHYKNIIIYDLFARKVKELTFKETIDVSELNAGSYWMIINSDDKSYRVNFIKE